MTRDACLTAFRAALQTRRGAFVLLAHQPGLYPRGDLLRVMVTDGGVRPGPPLLDPLGVIAWVRDGRWVLPVDTWQLAEAWLEPADRMACLEASDWSVARLRRRHAGPRAEAWRLGFEEAVSSILGGE